MQKVPYILVVGEKERDTSSVAVRVRSGGDLGSMSLEQFSQRLSEDIATRRNVGAA